MSTTRLRETTLTQTTILDIKDRVAYLGRRNKAYAQLCGFVGELLMLAAKANPNPILTTQQPGANGGLAAGRPFWDLNTLELDWPACWELLARLAGSLAGRPGGREAIRAAEVARRQAREGPGLFRDALLGDEKSLQRAAQELGVDQGVLRMLLRMALRPWLLAAAEQARGDTRLKDWSFGHCPVCGSPPALAELTGESRRRYLHCGLCETSWIFPRLACPFCENQNTGETSIIQAEEDEGLSVQICLRCGKYLKTIDLSQEAGPIIVPLDDAFTCHLDLIARRELAGD